MKNYVKMISVLICLLVCVMVSAIYSGPAIITIAGKIKQNYSNPNITHLRTVPVEKGWISHDSLLNSVKTAIKMDGSFVLNLDTKHDWLFLLIQTDTYGNETYAGQISMLLEKTNETLLLLPLTKAVASTIDLGTITYQKAFSITDKEIKSSDFSLNLEQLHLIARNDDHFSGIINIKVKSTGSIIIFYSLRTDFKWRGVYPDLVSDYSHPHQYGYRGYNFQLDTNSKEVDINETCGSTGWTKKKIELFPPVGTSVEDEYLPYTYSSTFPISNNSASCSTLVGGLVESRDDDFYASYNFGMSYTFGSTLITDPIPAGLWDFKVNDIMKEQFQPGVSVPKISDDRIDGLVPTIKVNTDIEGRIGSINIAWYEVDESTPYNYNPVTDSEVLSMLVGSADIYLENLYGTTGRYENIMLPSVTSTSVSPAGNWFFGDTGTAGERAEVIGIFWQSGTVGRFVRFPVYVYPAGEASCVLPIPKYEQPHIDRGQQYNAVYGGIRHEGLDFGFDLPKGKTGYILRDIVSPCDGIITEINEDIIPGSGNYAVSIMIKYNQSRSIMICFEPDSADQNIHSLQYDKISVTRGQIIYQGDLIGQLVVSTPSSPYVSGPHIHWTVYTMDSSGKITGDICPLNTCVPAAAKQLQSIYGSLPGMAPESHLLPVCLPASAP